MPYATSNPEFGFEQDFKVIQCTKSNLGQNWVNEFFYSIKELYNEWVRILVQLTPPHQNSFRSSPSESKKAFKLNV